MVFFSATTILFSINAAVAASKVQQSVVVNVATVEYRCVVQQTLFMLFTFTVHCKQANNKPRCVSCRSQQQDVDQWPVEGFYIYYAPFDEERLEYQRQVVLGSSVRHAVLSHLAPATSYSIRVQSYSVSGTMSEYSNTVVKQTIGKLLVLKIDHPMRLVC